ncbi:MAG: GNAT family N-acetyltransferase [Candidatus Bipolaricaulota bacterium]
MEVRRLGVDDAPLAQAVWADVRNGDTSGDAFAQWLACDERLFVAALDAGRPVGFALGYVLERTDALRRMVLLYEIEVAKAHRRRGVGRRLVEEVKAIARAYGAGKIWCVAEAGNQAARALYTSTGSEEADADFAVFTWHEPSFGDPEREE